MAINLLGSTNSALDYGDIAAIGGASELSVAITVLLTNATSNEPLVTQWDTFPDSAEAFALADFAGRGLQFYITDGTLTFSKRTTEAELIQQGPLNRIVVTWKAGTPGTMRIVLDGIDLALTAITSQNPLTIQDVNEPVLVGRSRTVTSNILDGPDGDYSELAIWIRELPLEAAKAISNGVSPLFYGKDLILYDRMADTNSARDIIGGITPSITAGIDADHPSILMPGSPIIGIPVAAAGGDGAARIIFLTGEI